MHHRNESESIKHLKQTKKKQKKLLQLKQHTKITCSDFLETKRVKNTELKEKISPKLTRF